jgi:hypothetical protein
MCDGIQKRGVYETLDKDHILDLSIKKVLILPIIRMGNQSSLLFGVAKVSIDSILFLRLLGENCNITVETQEQVEKIAGDVANQLSSEASVQAILYEKPEHPADQFDLSVIRDERFQPKTDSYERRVEETHRLSFH